MGSLSCPSFPPLDFDGEESEVYESGRGRTMAPYDEGVGTDGADFLLDSSRLGYLPGGKYWAGRSIFLWYLQQIPVHGALAEKQGDLSGHLRECCTHVFG